MKLKKNDEFVSIYEVDGFIEEFCSVVDESQSTEPPPRYLKWLSGKLAVLDDKKEKAIILRDFEDLKETITIDNTQYRIHSIRYPRSQINPRVLYTIHEDEIIILLCSFQESKGRQDYRKAIARAKSILGMIDKEEG